MTIATELTVNEGFLDPLGFHSPKPVFSWKLPQGVIKQTAYYIEVSNSSTVSPQVDWSSGWVESDQSVRVPYCGEPFASREQVKWRVRFRDQNGTESGWSDFATVEMGLLEASDWHAQWIRPSANAPESEPVSWLRRSFPLVEDVQQARLYVTARGLFEVNLNGRRVGDDSFANGWTSYTKRIDTLTYDVTNQLQTGDNELLVLLGCGWYSGHLVFEDRKHFYGTQPELLLQLEVTRSDGTVETIRSDEHWQGTIDGPIRSSSIYDGEIFDARVSVGNWGGVVANPDLGAARLIPKPFAPVRVMDELTVQKISEPGPGRFVFDLGQNMVGWARLRIPVEKGQTVTIRFAEMLNPEGSLYTENYRSAKSTDFYTAAQTGTIEWQPTFTFHGFRYVELSGLPEGAVPTSDWVTGVVLHSRFPTVGSFECSHGKLNQLQSNLVWGQRGNFLDIPTDCPQRDERLGWTGDAQVICPVSLFNFDCHAFWKSWLGSMRDDQFENGWIPHIIPDVIGDLFPGSPGWVDAAAFIPWELYLRTGDADVLAENYTMMVGMVGWYRDQTVDGLLPNIEGFGDWLQPYAKDKTGDTPHHLLGMAYYARCVQILADSARVLKRTADIDKYAAEAVAVADKFAEHYFDTDGRLKNTAETQTAYLLAIAYNLISEDIQITAAKHLVRLVDEADGHLRTGFLGTPYIVAVLDQVGRSDLAYRVLFQESYPSWFFTINQGATTMWERWNSYTHEDGFGDVSMNSFNHYAYGAIGQWMVERIAGLTPDPAYPGYKQFRIRPMPGGPLQWACAEFESPYGKASSGWQIEGTKLIIKVTIPPNTTASVELPDGSATRVVQPGAHFFELDWAQEKRDESCV